MPGKRVLLKHEIERSIQSLDRQLPRDQSARGQICSHERLADAPNRPGAEHHLDSLDSGVEINAGTPGYFAQRIPLESLNLVLGYGEDTGVNGIVDSKRSWCAYVHFEGRNI